MYTSNVPGAPTTSHLFYYVFFFFFFFFFSAPCCYLFCTVLSESSLISSLFADINLYYAVAGS